MAAVDKVEYLKKHGPLPQFNRRVKFDKKTGNLIIFDRMNVKEIKKKKEVPTSPTK